MDAKQASIWRQRAGKICMCFCLLAFLAVLDGVIAKFREPANVFHLLPGEVEGINGPIPETIKGPEELTAVSDSPHLAITFDAIHSGYFLGGNMWRGRLRADGAAVPGKYTLTVRPRNYPEDKPGYQVRAVVYQDYLSQRAAFKSLFKRLTGQSPYLAAALLLPFIGLSLGAVFWLSRRLEGLQARSGLAEIYWAKRSDGEYRVAFGLGSRHGIKDGDQLNILDPKGNLVGTARVEETSDNDAVAMATANQVIRAGFFVSR